MQRSIFVCALITLTLSGCNGWVVQPIPYTPATPIPTRTPSIYTATPLILAPPITATSTSKTPGSPTDTFTITPSPVSTFTATPESATFTAVPSPQVKIEILGCNTSIDITHGMGEVTNAYVTISNTGTGELTNVCATLRGLDEGRPHPDKTKCVPSLPSGYQVTLKLTVDTTYKKDTPIQVDVTSNADLLQRLGKDSCTDISLFPPGVDDLDVIKPIP